MAAPSEGAVRDLSAGALADLLGAESSVPEDLAHFVREGLRDRLRSATDSYFDLGDSVVPVDGGRLLHLVSDSQWVFHWLLHLGDDGGSAVVGTTAPVGFTADPEDADALLPQTWGCVRVADSFADFLWRWWMDNEVF